MRFKQITIIGVGLIGGSIGLAVKRRRLAARVVGVTVHKESLKKAILRKVIDSGTMDVRKSVLGSDMVILATPVDKILPTLKNIAPHLKKDAIIIDVASVKGPIVRKAEKIIARKGAFVGVHPMAGSEHRGVESAGSYLFAGAPCVIAKTKRTDRKALSKVRDFWKNLGAKIYILSPEAHDIRISSVSHLPHVAASSLSSAAKISSLKFAATGFKDTTRIASGDPKLWASILVSNKTNVAKDIKDYIKDLQRARRLIAGGKENELCRYLMSAKRKRDKFFVNEK